MPNEFVSIKIFCVVLKKIELVDRKSKKDNTHGHFFFDECLPKVHPAKTWNTLFFTSTLGTKEGVVPGVAVTMSLYRLPRLIFILAPINKPLTGCISIP